MIDFMFFVKTVCLTIVLVILMQIRVGEGTIETHVMNVMQSSVIVSPLNSVANGAAKLVRDVTASVSSKVTHKSDKQKEEEKKSSSSFRWN